MSFLYIAVRVVETAIIGRCRYLVNGKLENILLIPTYVCNYLSILTVFDACIPTTRVQGARRVFVLDQDQLYLATKPRGSVALSIL
jgi:hypothetical protein